MKRKMVMGSGKSVLIKRSGIVMAGVMLLAGISGCGNAAAGIQAVKEKMRSKGQGFWYEDTRDLEGVRNTGGMENIEGTEDIGDSENMEIAEDEEDAGMAEDIGDTEETKDIKDRKDAEGVKEAENIGNAENMEGAEKIEDTADKKETEKIAELCRKLYKTAQQENNPNHLETVRRIINGLGEAGYAAVDSENQVDMAEYAQAVRFCEKAEAKKEAEPRIAVTDYPSGFVIYYLQAKDGKITVNKSGYAYKNGTAEKTAAGSYEAEHWEYTKEGYLIFSGSWFSEEMYVLVLEDMEEHTALRVQPLEASCRELNRKYILPAGYEKNNLFLTDWSEEDFGELNFYDAFDRCYEMMCGWPVPYTADGDLNAGTAYRIPAEIFEGIIRKYFDINVRTLRDRAVYFPEDMTYEYMPRGFYEGGYCEIPYPEVEDYMENGDGTVTLFVNAVYPKENTSGAYRHKTVIRPLDDGSFQYVSNQMIYEGEEYDAWWNTKRLSREER